MVTYLDGDDIFTSKTDALVNPVNCVGTMGKGIALEFKRRFPECVWPYTYACQNGLLVPGKLLFVHVTVSPDLFGEHRPAVILFPTKNHWRAKSQVVWIDRGLSFLKAHYKEWGLRSVAMPQIGCGLGGLSWDEVKPLIEKTFAEEPIDVEVYINATTEYGEKATQK